MKTIELNKEIYKSEAIMSAISGFSEAGEFKIKDIGKSWIITISGADEDLLRDEFANYCLGLTIVNKKN